MASLAAGSPPQALLFPSPASSFPVSSRLSRRPPKGGRSVTQTPPRRHLKRGQQQRTPKAKEKARARGGRTREREAGKEKLRRHEATRKPGGGQARPIRFPASLPPPHAFCPTTPTRTSAPPLLPPPPRHGDPLRLLRPRSPSRSPVAPSARARPPRDRGGVRCHLS